MRISQFGLRPLWIHKLCENNSIEYVVDELEEVFTKFEETFQKNNVEKIKTVGDCIVGSSGISTVSS